MKTVYNTSILKDRLFELVQKDDDKTESNGQLVRFFNWMYKKDFLRNLSDRDYENIMDKNAEGLSLSIIRSHSIAIGMDIWSKYIRIGIDPSDCFDKIGNCSILVRFPLSKRDEKRFYSLLENLLDKKSKINKDWFRNASSYWCGSYAKIGNV